MANLKSTTINGTLNITASETIEGHLLVKEGATFFGTTAANPIIVRGITGSDGNGGIGDLYLNYNSGTVYFSTNGRASVNNGVFSGQAYTAVAKSSSWIEGRTNAIFKVTTISGYSPAISIKTNNGSWEIGAYDNSSFYDDLIFTYCTDTNFNNNNNATTAQVHLYENGQFTGKTIYDGSGNTITSYYCTLSTTQTISGQKTFTGNLYINKGLTASGVIYGTDVRGNRTRLTDNWLGFYQSSNAGGSRYGYIQTDANRMYFRKENGVNTYHFDFNGNIYLSGSLTSGSTITAKSTITTNSGNVNAPAGSIWAGTYKNTAAERQVGTQSGAGRLYMYSAGAATGGRGLYGTNNAGKSASYLSINQSNAATHSTNSDKRIKSDKGLLSIEETKNILTELKIVNFNYKLDEENEIKQNVEHCGVYAQDVRDLLLKYNYKNRNLLLMTIKNDQLYQDEEELIPITPDISSDITIPEEKVDLYQMNYTALISYLVKGWQIHEQQIQELKQITSH